MTTENLKLSRYLNIEKQTNIRKCNYFWSTRFKEFQEKTVKLEGRIKKNRELRSYSTKQKDKIR